MPPTKGATTIRLGGANRSGVDRPHGDCRPGGRPGRGAVALPPDLHRLLLQTPTESVVAGERWLSSPGPVSPLLRGGSGLRGPMTRLLRDGAEATGHASAGELVTEFLLWKFRAFTPEALWSVSRASRPDLDRGFGQFVASLPPIVAFDDENSGHRRTCPAD